MPDSPAGESIEGLVERVTFHNPDNGFCVLRVKVRGHRELVTLVGHAPSVSAGEHVDAHGRWQTDRDHGVQFGARMLRVTPPTTIEGIEKYLGSGMIRGIGPAFAKRLVGAFGGDVFDVIETAPARLREVDGIGPVRLERLTAAWADQKVIRRIMVFLHSNGVSTSRAVRIFKTYGNDAIEIVSENPYRLARDIRGIGFLTADTIAQKMGIARTAMIRARAGISYALAEATSEGHCGLPHRDLIPMAVKLLEIPDDIVRDALGHELAEGTVVEDTVDEQPCVFLAGLHAAERGIAAGLRALQSEPVPWPAVDTRRAVSWVERRLGMTLSESQKAAIALAVGAKTAVITGGPGVGKTTLVNAILGILRAKQVRVLLCAPTGRAAKRLTESTGIEAKTIHRLLEVDPRHGGFARHADRPLECDLLVADECSMIDVPLMHALVKAVPRRAALLLVGDVDQLPSVGAGQVLEDVIASGALPVVRLTEVFRQAAKSRIIVNAHRINQGRMPELDTEKGTLTDFYFIDAEEPEEVVHKLVQVVTQRIPAQFGLSPVTDIQVLCPMNRSSTGARALNTVLQAALNPPGAASVERFGARFGAGDKVMQTENDYDKEVFNGDVGIVARVDQEEREVAIEFDGRSVVYGFDELDQVVLAYATTVHKSQGSEYPAVVIPVTTQHYMMLRRNLVYTAVTRGRKLVVMIGQRKALAMAINARTDQRRWTKLKEWLRQSS